MTFDQWLRWLLNFAYSGADVRGSATRRKLEDDVRKFIVGPAGYFVDAGQKQPAHSWEEAHFLRI